jgi:UDP-glucose 4-epimerase
MKVLITGGAGFIGSHLADAFVARGDDVTVFDKQPQLHEFRASYVNGDLLDRYAVDKVVRGQDFIIHAGGILGTHETISACAETCKVNILGGLHVLDSVCKYGNCLINISKPNVWLNPYSITKDCIEKFGFMYVSEFNMKIGIVKLFNAYGPRQKYSGVQKAIPYWIVSAFRGEPLKVFGQGTSTMDLVYTRDVTDGIIAILDNFDRCRLRKSHGIAHDVWGNFQAYNNQILELGSGAAMTVNDALKELEQALGTSLDRHYLPMRRGEVEGTRLRADVSRLSQLTGYQPKVSIQEGLKETIGYYQEHLTLIDQGML